MKRHPDYSVDRDNNFLEDKICVKCRKEYPRTPEHYGRNIRLKDGLDTICKSCKKEYNETQRESRREYYKEYHQDNREYRKMYYEKNKHYYKSKAQERREKMEELEHNLTEDEWIECLEYFEYRCAYCGKEDTTGLEQEHVIPLSKGGGYTIKNIIPSCGYCNRSKHTMDVEKWFKGRDYYRVKRLNNINNYLNPQ